MTPEVRGRGWLTTRGQAVPALFVGRAGQAGLTIDPGQARSLSALAGDALTVVSSRTRLSPLGPVPITASLLLGGIAPAATGRREPEARLPLEEARRLLALAPGEATGYELRLSDPDRADEVARAAAAAAGLPVTTTTWQQANRPLVLALRLERVVLFATVFLVVVVAGLNLAATSAVLVATRSADAAVLSVLGAAPKAIERVFVAAGLLLGAAGTAAGLLGGAALAVALDRTAAIPLPAQLFSLAHVPFRVEPLDVGAVAVFSLLWSYVAASVPARLAARLPVTEVLRAV